MTRQTDWGHADPRHNAELSAASATLKKRLLSITAKKNGDKVKKSEQAEQAVCDFIRKYLMIGPDPTDTLIRDRVWEFLLRVTPKTLIAPARLDELWTDEVRRSQQSCSVM